MKAFVILALGLLALGQISSAAKIQWFCPPHSENLTEAGLFMGPDFVFELGVFKAGFSPTIENRTEWAANWVPAQRAPYHSVNRWYSSVFDVVDNSGDFARNTPAWVWGFSGGPESGEWLLFRKQSWKWPSADSINPISHSWKASEADVVLMGSVGQLTLLRSEKVQNALPPTTNWAQWRRQYLGNRASESGSDLNQNDIPDLFEYASGKDQAGRLKLVATGNGFELRIPRRLDRPATFNVEVSYDLNEWFSGGDLVSLLRSDFSELVFQDLVSDESTAQLFWRYSVEPE